MWQDCKPERCLPGAARRGAGRLAAGHEGVYDWCNHTHREFTRTNIELDDRLVAEAMSATGLRTKKAAVEEALRRLVRAERQRKAIEDMRGLGWDADATMIHDP